MKTGGLPAATKTIHIVRDIRDLTVPMNRTGWVSDLDLNFPRYWRNNNLYLNSIHKENSHQYTLVQYEDPASDRSQVLAKF